MKFYEKAWFIVLMALFIPPVALVLVLFKKKSMNKVLKIAVTVVLAFYSLLWIIALFVPADSVDTDTTTQAVTETATKEIVTTVKENTTKNVTTTEEKTTKEETTEETTEKVSDTTMQKAEVAQKVEEKTTVKSTPNTTKEQKEETTTKKIVTTTKDPEASVVVYRTATGECYHHENPCGRGNYYEVSLAEAKAAGLRECEKCVLH